VTALSNTADGIESAARAAPATLAMSNITKLYHGVSALREVDFSLRGGEVHALLGENGAGKSTLSKLMCGVIQPSGGTIAIDGEVVDLSSPARARAHGIAMVFQETSLVPSMSVAQNIFLGDEAVFNRLRPLHMAAQLLLNSLNFDIDPRAQVATLGAAKKQMVEIARAVRQQARFLIFDEPTATLTPEEKRYFFRLVQDLKARGVGIVFISHALEEAMEIADRITILRDGALVVTDAASTFSRASIVRAMVGRALLADGQTGERRRARARGAAVLSVQNLSMGRMVRNNSFSLYGGQVAGLFGLIGSGRTETTKIIGGYLTRDTFFGGSVLLDGRPVNYRTPREAIKDGVIYVTEDRKVEGFFHGMSIGENLRIADLVTSQAALSLVVGSRSAQLYADWKERLSIRALSERASVLELSGGNQQKVVIAKALLQKPKVIIFDEPTRGVDVGAIEEIHKLIHQLAADGLAVLVVSSYLPEIRSLSDRVLISRNGRVVAELEPTASDDEIMFAAVH
jgi:ABC-type sugar transport system ATPase subunit